MPENLYIYIYIYGGKVGGNPPGYLAGAKLLLDRRTPPQPLGDPLSQNDTGGNPAERQLELF